MCFVTIIILKRTYFDIVKYKENLWVNNNPDDEKHYFRSSESLIC